MKSETGIHPDLTALRNGFTAWMQAQGLSPATVQLSRSDAFYLLRHGDATDFWALLQSEDFDRQARAQLQSALKQNSGGNTATRLSGYLSCLRRLRRYLDLDPNWDAAKAPETTPSAGRSGVRRGSLPPPSAGQLRLYQLRWDGTESYREQECALNRLFHQLAPGNRDISDILLKAAALNQFYSTNIFSIYPVAAHILALDIDPRLRAGDMSLVDDISSVAINGKHRQFYSFASKYCSHHAPDAFPIYDSYVDEVLRCYRDTDAFASFRSAS